MSAVVARPAPRPVRSAATTLLAVAAVAGTLVGVLSGCAGGHKAASSGTATVAATSVPALPGQRLAEWALLEASDLPLGFAPEQASTDSTQAMGCAGIDSLYLGSGVTGRAAISFTHSLSDIYVNETITMRPGTAGVTLAAFRQAAQSCRTFSGKGTASYRVAAVTSVGRYGDGSAAVRITGSMREARPVVLVAVRIDDLVLVVAHADSGRVDPEVTRTLVSRAVAKAKRVLATG